MVEISRRNPGECIEGKDDAIAYLNAAAETGDPTLLQVAIGDVAKARGMGQVAKEAGVGRGGRIVVESMSTGANGIRIKGSKVGLYKANGKALKTTGRDE